mmetsp:Transcript_58776/g.96534  ORF Transcript_58776/g.96534 Transcript_58776/m.96534 type:complete len:239 (-) Transcript_58776:682-1398(-)
MVAMITVDEFPPSAGRRMRVSLESRYGMCSFGPVARALTTLPRANRLLRMLLPSRSRVSRRARCSGSFFLSLIREKSMGRDVCSDPARSTTLRVDTRTMASSTCRLSKINWKIVCDRDACSCTLLRPNMRRASPFAASCLTSSRHPTTVSVTLPTFTRPSLSSVMMRVGCSSASRSLSCSLYTSRNDTRSSDTRSGVARMWSKKSLTASAMRPTELPVPLMVCVFPLLVCPYAMMQPL